MHPYIYTMWGGGRVRNSARIWKLILAEILLNKVTRIQENSRNTCWFTYKLSGGEFKDLPNFFAKRGLKWRKNGLTFGKFYVKGEDNMTLVNQEKKYIVCVLNLTILCWEVSEII